MIRKKLGFCFIILWMISTVVPDAEFLDNHQIGKRKEFETLFTDMEPKSSPLYLCDSRLGGIEYQPPSTLDCNTNPHDNDTKKHVSVTLFWDDISVHSIDGYECTGFREEAAPVRFFFVNQYFTTAAYYLKISDTECKKMVYEKVAPNGDILKEQSPDSWETENRETYVSSWFSFGAAIKKYVQNYKIQKLKVGIREADGIIRTTAQIEAPCHYNESHCKSTTGILVWKVDDVKTCRLLEGDKSNCLLRNGTDGVHLTCPDLTLALHDIQEISLCGEIFGSSQGIYFLHNEQGQISNTMSTPEMVLKKITKPRVKREVARSKVNPFEAEVKANLNFLYNTIRKGTSEAIWKFENKICEINRRQLEMMSMLSQSGHPSLTTRFMYKNPSLRAEYVGDLLMVYQCIEVREYMFMERRNCTYQWPIQYLSGRQVYTGYIEPLTHTIVDVPTQQNDRTNDECRRFFFKTEDYVVLLTKNKAIPIKAEKLPHPGLSNSKNLFPSLTFLSRSTMQTSSDESMESLYIWLREIQQRNAPRAQTTSTKHLIVKSDTFWGSVGSLLANIVSGVFSGAWSILSWFFSGFFSMFSFLGYIVVGSIILLLLFKAGLLFKCIRLPLRMLGCLFRALPKDTSTDNFAKKVSKAFRHPRSEEKTFDPYKPSAPKIERC